MIPRRARQGLPARLLPLLLAGGMAGALAAGPVPEAGFDCARARSALEQAICADAETAAADRAMALAYQALIARALPEVAAALQADQSSFLAIRQQAFDVKGNRQMALTRLREETELRAEWLNQISPEPAPGFAGAWGNAWGLMRITPVAEGIFRLEATVADQVAGTWLCGYDGTLEALSNGEAVGRTLTADLQLRRTAALLEVLNPFCDETGPALSGSMQGRYFRIGAPD